MGHLLTFKADQLRYPRVRNAYQEKELLIDELLHDKNLKKDDLHIFMRIFKDTQVLEVWGRKTSGSTFTLIKTYSFCSSSGDLGPKRKQGDGQIPEGFYYIDRFNPGSRFHLSLGINYPNKSDRMFGDKTNPGGDIFIHGSCVTIGCIPITNDKIKEVYILAVEARNNGQAEIPVHIFPTHLTEINLSLLEERYAMTGHNEFWKNLTPRYRYFNEKKILPVISVDESGYYVIE